MFFCVVFFLFFFLCFLFFYFIKISKFALPGVMLMYERTSKDRKKMCCLLYINAVCNASINTSSYNINIY